MAETVIPLSINDCTLTFSDGTTPTPVTYTVRLTEGTVTLTDGEYEHFMATDAMGVPLSGTAPRQAGVRRMCGATFSCKIFDVGKKTSGTEYVFLDVVRNEGEWNTDTTPTTTSPDSTMHTWDLFLTVANRGSEKGGVYKIPNARLSGNLAIEISRAGGWLVSGMEWISTTDVKYGLTRNV